MTEAIDRAQPPQGCWATLKRLTTFITGVPRSSSCSFDQPCKG